MAILGKYGKQEFSVINISWPLQVCNTDKKTKKTLQLRIWQKKNLFQKGFKAFFQENTSLYYKYFFVFLAFQYRDTCINYSFLCKWMLEM